MASEFSSSGVSRFDNRDMGAPWIRCEVRKPLAEQRDIGHNRWHQDIPPLIEIEPGGEVILESPGLLPHQSMLPKFYPLIPVPAKTSSPLPLCSSSSSSGAAHTSFLAMTPRQSLTLRWSVRS